MHFRLDMKLLIEYLFQSVVQNVKLYQFLISFLYPNIELFGAAFCVRTSDWLGVLQTLYLFIDFSWFGKKFNSFIYLVKPLTRERSDLL